jgi:hypothetical protein
MLIRKNAFPQNYDVTVPIKTENSIFLHADQIINYDFNTLFNKNFCLILTLEEMQNLHVKSFSKKLLNNLLANTIKDYEKNLPENIKNILSLLCCFINTVCDLTERDIKENNNNFYYRRFLVSSFTAYQVTLSIIEEKTEFNFETQVFFKMEQKILNGLLYYKNYFRIFEEYDNEVKKEILTYLKNYYDVRRLSNKLFGKQNIKIIFTEETNKTGFPYIFNTKALKNNYFVVPALTSENLANFRSTIKDYCFDFSNLNYDLVFDNIKKVVIGKKLQIAYSVVLVNTYFKHCNKEKDTVFKTIFVVSKILLEVNRLLPQTKAKDALWENVFKEQMKEKIFNFMFFLEVSPQIYSVILKKNVDYEENKHFNQYVLDYANYFFNRTKKRKNENNYWTAFPTSYTAVFSKPPKIKTQFSQKENTEEIKENTEKIKINPYKQKRKQYKEQK